jgi:hypothetical protein
MQKIALILVAVIVSIATFGEAVAQKVVKRVCSTDAYGTRTCTEYFQNGQAREPRTDRIMGMPSAHVEAAN